MKKFIYPVCIGCGKKTPSLFMWRCHDCHYKYSWGKKGEGQKK